MDILKLAEEAKRQVALEGLFKGGNSEEGLSLVKEAVQEMKLEREIEKAAEEGYLAGYLDAAGAPDGPDYEKTASGDFEEGYLAALEEIEKLGAGEGPGRFRRGMNWMGGKARGAGSWMGRNKLLTAALLGLPMAGAGAGYAAGRRGRRD